ncbi:MAG: PqqD family protein [Gemmatimonadaceae bacterium]|nr:PqqD family protein [Gloeobacterales cyanobacterium ES-bin-141]
MSAKKPQARNDVLTQELVDGTVVVFDPLTSVAHELNTAAALVWECCDGGHSFKQIVAVFSECFGPSAYDADVTAFLHYLGQISLLEVPASEQEHPWAA